MDEFIHRAMNDKAFSRSPFQFVDRDTHDCLAIIQEIRLIEYGMDTPRRTWQNAQLANLLDHAKKQSNFWRKNIPSRRGGMEILKYISPLSRDSLSEQIGKEGSLWKEPDGSTPQTYQTSGSTGRPVRPFVTKLNGIYNTYRGLAEYIIHNRSFNLNRVKLERNETDNNSITVQDHPNWAGPLAKIFQNGSYRAIGYGDDDNAAIKELAKRSVGYLRCRNNTLEQFIARFGLSIFRELDIRAWVHVGDGYDLDLARQLEDIGVDTFSTYSSGELGPIGFSCAKMKEHYHVATSNVVVEADDTIKVGLNGVTLSRLLVTGLHSYATPIIRYDIGDFGRLLTTCPCGHNGPTLSHVFGRRKSFLRQPNGSLIPFYARGHEVLRGLHFIDSRIKQISDTQLNIEISGCDNFDQKMQAIITDRLHRLAGYEYNLNFILTDRIDWSDSSKRLFFTCYSENMAPSSNR